MLEPALQYGARGLRVFPCRPDDKRPLVRWTQFASSKPASIRSMFLKHPDSLIGLCTGSGLVVVDDDRGLAEPDPDLAGTLTARTRNRGFHHYYRASEYVPCSVGRIGPGIDVRGDGGYVIAPPSPGWEWINDVPMLELPPVLLAKSAPPPSTGGQKFVERDRVSEGGRNDYIARYVGWLLRQEVDDVVDLALEHNYDVCVPPLPDDEVRAVARSIIRTHNARAAA